VKRTILATFAIACLTACAGITAPGAVKSDTPQQSLTAIGQAMSNLQSVRFFVNGTATLSIPQQVAEQLRAKAGTRASFLGSSTTVSLKISGAAAKPDKLDATIEVSTGGLTIATEVVAIGGNLYYKNPMTGQWKSLSKPNHDLTGAAKPKLAYQAVIDTAKSLTEVNDNPGRIDGVAVDHYWIVPDLVKLFETLAPNDTTSSSSAMTAIRGILQNATLTADVWTGTSDHLIRRLSYDVDVSADLHQLAGAAADQAGAAASPLTIPAGSIARVTAHVVVDLRDFNSSVTIKAPTLG
jgi:hypothetical protein